jgi:hypothetical protein
MSLYASYGSIQNLPKQLLLLYNKTTVSSVKITVAYVRKNFTKKSRVKKQNG